MRASGLSLVKPLTEAEHAAGICPTCRKQPCTCALAADPFWIDALEIELDCQAIEDACDDYLKKWATRHAGNVVATATYKAVNECAEVMALARSLLRKRPT